MHFLKCITINKQPHLFTVLHVQVNFAIVAPTGDYWNCRRKRCNYPPVLHKDTSLTSDLLFKQLLETKYSYSPAVNKKKQAV